MAKSRYSFGRFVLDESTRVLTERDRPVRIGGKAFALLEALLKADGQVVSKLDLMDAAWPNIAVEESNLTVQISALRKMLGAAPNGSSWVDTFPGVGYRFAGPSATGDDLPAGADGPANVKLEAYDFFVRGRSLIMQSPAGNALARDLLNKAIALDPDFADAYGHLAIACFSAAIHYGEDPADNQALGLAHALKAVSIAPQNPRTHGALGYIRLYQGKLDEAEHAFKTALAYAPNDPSILTNLTELRVLQGQPRDAVRLVEDVLRVIAYPPGWYLWDAAFAYYAAGRYCDAADMLRHVEVSRLPARRILAASLAQLGHGEEARAEAAEFLKLNPGFQANRWAATQPFRYGTDRQHFVDGYLKAGLPA